MTTITTIELQPGEYGIDAAWGLTVALVEQLAATGIPLPDGRHVRCAFIVGYVSSNASKNLHADVIVRAHQLGIAVLVVLEQSATRALGGALAGRADGILAVQQVEGFPDGGYPKECGIIFAVDFAPTAAQLPVVNAYGSAFDEPLAAAGFPEGEYAGTDELEAAVAAGLPIRVGWEAAADSWSHIPSAHVHIRQLIAGSSTVYDLNVVVQPCLAWLPHEAPTPAPPEVPMSRYLAILGPDLDHITEAALVEPIFVDQFNTAHHMVGTDATSARTWPLPLVFCDQTKWQWHLDRHVDLPAATPPAQPTACLFQPTKMPLALQGTISGVIAPA